MPLTKTIRTWGSSLCVLAFVLPLAAADEPAHFKFVDGLRKRGMHDLAIEYLEELQKRQKPPLAAAIKSLIPFEIAKTRADLAARERDLAKRDRLFKQAQTELNHFVAKNPKHPLAGHAHFDLGRMFMEMGRVKGVETRHARTKEDRESLAKEAILHFRSALKSFEESNRRLNEAWNAIDPKLRDDKQLALGDYLLSLHYHAQTLYEMSLTEQSLGKDPAAAAASMKNATEAFARIADYRDQHSLGWESLAWHARCVQHIDKRKAEPILKQVLDGRTREADAGKRLVRYFQIIDAWALGLGDNERARVRDWLQTWRNDFREYSTSPEGQHVRLMLALTNAEELSQMKPEQRKSDFGKTLFRDTRVLFQELEDEHGEYAPVARNAKYGLLRLSEELMGTPLAEINTIDECLLRADVERANAFDALDSVEKADPKDRPALEETAKKGFKGMIAACERALELMPEQPRKEDWERTHLLLYIGFTRLDDGERAVRILESLSRSSKTTDDVARRASITAFESLQTRYRGARTPERKDADYQRMIEMARFMDERWPHGVETDSARYQLGFHLIRKDGKPMEAAKKWEAISPQHSTYPEVNYRAGLLYWAMHAEAAEKAGKPDTIESPERTRCIQLLRKASDAGKQLVDRDNKKLERDGETHVLAGMALAEVLHRIGQSDDAAKIVTPFLERLEKKTLPADMPAGTESRILGLALRLYVHKKDIPKALQVLETLEKAGGEPEEIVGVYRQLGDQLQTQIAALEQKADPESKRQLEQMRSTLRELLVNVESKINAKTPMGLRLWLAANFVNLAEHTKAAKIYAELPEPPSDARPAVIEAYHSAQFQKIRCMRLAAAAEADPAKRKEQLASAETELKAVTEKLKMHKHPNFVHEKIVLLQLQEKYSGPDGAIALWDQMRRALESYRDTKDQTKFYLRNLYFESCFNLVVCKYEEAKRLSDTTARDKAIQDTASVLIPLMKIEVLKPKFEEYLKDPDRKPLRAKLPK